MFRWLVAGETSTEGSSPPPTCTLRPASATSDCPTAPDGHGDGCGKREPRTRTLGHGRLRGASGSRAGRTGRLGCDVGSHGDGAAAPARGRAGGSASAAGPPRAAPTRRDATRGGKPSQRRRGGCGREAPKHVGGWWRSDDGRSGGVEWAQQRAPDRSAAWRQSRGGRDRDLSAEPPSDCRSNKLTGACPPEIVFHWRLRSLKQGLTRSDPEAIQAISASALRNILYRLFCPELELLWVAAHKERWCFVPDPGGIPRSLEVGGTPPLLHPSSRAGESAPTLRAPRSACGCVDRKTAKDQVRANLTMQQDYP